MLGRLRGVGESGQRYQPQQAGSRPLRRAAGARGGSAKSLRCQSPTGLASLLSASWLVPRVQPCAGEPAWTTVQTLIRDAAALPHLEKPTPHGGPMKATRIVPAIHLAALVLSVCTALGGCSHPAQGALDQNQSVWTGQRPAKYQFTFRWGC